VDTEDFQSAQTRAWVGLSVLTSDGKPDLRSARRLRRVEWICPIPDEPTGIANED